MPPPSAPSQASSERPPENRRLTVEQAEEELLRRLNQAENDLRETLYNLTTLYKQTRQTEKALPLMQRLIDLARGPGEKAQFLLTYGQLMEGMHDFQKAVEYYSRAHALEPVDQSIWYFINNNLGYSLNQLGQFREAESFCREAIKTDPERYNAYKNLGIAQEGLGRFAEAALSYLASIRANAGDPRAFNHLSDLLRAHPGLPSQDARLEAEMRRCEETTPLAAEALRTLRAQYKRPAE